MQSRSRGPDSPTNRGATGVGTHTHTTSAGISLWNLASLGASTQALPMGHARSSTHPWKHVVHHIGADDNWVIFRRVGTKVVFFAKVDSAKKDCVNPAKGRKSKVQFSLDQSAVSLQLADIPYTRPVDRPAKQNEFQSVYYLVCLQYTHELLPSSSRSFVFLLSSSPHFSSNSSPYSSVNRLPCICFDMTIAWTHESLGITPYSSHRMINR